METITAAPARIEIGQPFSPAAAVAGTVIVTAARPFGHRAVFATQTPCCGRNVQVDAVRWGADGFPCTCADCGWRWYVHLARDGARTGDLPPGTRHPDIDAGQAEWESRGFGTEPRRARRRW